MITNSPRYDAAMLIAKTVGTNFKTLRNNKRALACGLILACAVEDYKWRDAWAEAKKAAGFAKLEKDEQNQFNVMGTACRIVIDNYDLLTDDEKEAIGNLTCATSTIAKRIKDAEKAADEAAKAEAEKVKAGEDASQHADEDIDGKVEPIAEDRSSMVATVAAMFRVDASAADFTQGELDAMLDLIAAVEEFKAATIAKQKAA